MGEAIQRRAGRGLRLAGACLEIESSPGDGTGCYLVLPESTDASLILVVGRWATDYGNARLTIVRDPSGAYRISAVYEATGEP